MKSGGVIQVVQYELVLSCNLPSHPTHRFGKGGIVCKYPINAPNFERSTTLRALTNGA